MYCINISIMNLKNLILPLLLSATTTLRAVETVTEYILDTVDSGEGSWPCLFYELNYNKDITQAERAKWYSLDEDESYWREGMGPFSIDANKFLVTQWQSTVHPILIRRHFTLTEEDLLKISVGTVTLTYSYDENPTIWLNGTKIVSATGWNDNNYASLILTGARKKLLVEGDNVLCVSLQQGEGGGHIDFGLSVKYNPMHDGITSPSLSLTKREGDIYDLSGRKISSSDNSSLKNGIIISQGKKIFIK
jgi:hypothetical protein